MHTSCHGLSRHWLGISARLVAHCYVPWSNTCAKATKMSGLAGADLDSRWCTGQNRLLKFIHIPVASCSVRAFCSAPLDLSVLEARDVPASSRGGRRGRRRRVLGGGARVGRPTRCPTHRLADG